MKKDRLAQFRKKTIKELQAEIANLKKTLQQKKLEAEAGKLKNVKMIKNLGRDQAQLLTILQVKKFTEIQNVENTKEEGGGNEKSHDR